MISRRSIRTLSFLLHDDFKNNFIAGLSDKTQKIHKMT